LRYPILFRPSREILAGSISLGDVTTLATKRITILGILSHVQHIGPIPSREFVGSPQLIAIMTAHVGMAEGDFVRVVAGPSESNLVTS